MDKLTQYRQDLDLIDQKIMELINERFLVIEKIKDYKNINKLPVLDKAREEIILAKTNHYLYKDNIKAIYQTILKESKEFQRD